MNTHAAADNTKLRFTMRTLAGHKVMVTAESVRKLAVVAKNMSAHSIPISDFESERIFAEAAKRFSAKVEKNACADSQPLPHASGMTPEEIAELRKSIGISQRKFGNIIGVSARTVGGWEHGVTPSSACLKILIVLKLFVTPTAK